MFDVGRATRDSNDDHNERDKETDGWTAEGLCVCLR